MIIPSQTEWQVGETLADTLDDMWERILWSTGFRHIGHVADVILAPLRVMGGFPVIERLQAVGRQFFTRLGAQSAFIDDKVLIKDPRQHLMRCFIGASIGQGCHQLVHQLTGLLEMPLVPC